MWKLLRSHPFCHSLPPPSLPSHALFRISTPLNFYPLSQNHHSFSLYAKSRRRFIQPLHNRMSSKKTSNGRSPLVSQHRQITAFLGKKPGDHLRLLPNRLSPSISNLNPNPKGSPSPSPSPITPSPLQSKGKKPLLVISPNLGASSAEKPSSETKSYGLEVVDRRIRVYWPLDKSWYEGVVKSFDEISGKHLVQYVDADEEKLNWKRLNGLRSWRGSLGG